MPGFEETLNSVAAPYFEQVETGAFTASEYSGLLEGITGFESNGQDAFALNMPVNGLSRDLRMSTGLEINQQPIGDRFVLRAMVGYATAAALVNNHELFVMKLSVIINNLVGSAYKVYGQRIRNLTFRRPSGRFRNDFFRESDNNAGYEIRLFGELTPVSELLELDMETVENG